MIPTGGKTVAGKKNTAADARFDLEPVDDSSLDNIFKKQWALALLNKVLNRLEDECRDFFSIAILVFTLQASLPLTCPHCQFKCGHVSFLSAALRGGIDLKLRPKIFSLLFAP